jgi:hypothetical protein
LGLNPVAAVQHTFNTNNTQNTENVTNITIKKLNIHNGTTTMRHTGHVTAHYMIYHPFDCISSNSEGSKKISDDGRLLPKHVGATI